MSEDKVNTDLYKRCVEVAAKAIKEKGHNLDAKTQVDNIFAYSASDKKFNDIISKGLGSREAIELRNQIKYICELGLDTAKGKKLVYVKTRGLNVGTKDKKIWVTMPDIQESYHALIHLLVRSELIKHVVVLHTFENYPIEYSGEINKAPIVKAWETKPAERGVYTGCFVVLTYPDGELNTSYHHLSDIVATHKAFSKSGSTWKTHEQAMVAKSAILDATRYIPKLDTVVSKVVEHYDQTMDYTNPGITEEQEKEIKALQEKLGIKRELEDLTSKQAEALIIQLTAQVKKIDSPKEAKDD